MKKVIVSICLIPCFLGSQYPRTFAQSLRRGWPWSISQHLEGISQLWPARRFLDVRLIWRGTRPTWDRFWTTWKHFGKGPNSCRPLRRLWTKPEHWCLQRHGRKAEQQSHLVGTNQIFSVQKDGKVGRWDERTTALEQQHKLALTLSPGFIFIIWFVKFTISKKFVTFTIFFKAITQ